jgi:glycosyltransferase involved in cell wall biosynthesis
MNLSVIMPVYNEISTIREIIDRVLDVEIVSELLIVDDGSSDGTREALAEFRDDPRIRLILHEHNQGKGAAVVTGMRAARGQIMIVQDADLEYDPQEYRKLVAPVAAGEYDVVYGSRFASTKTKRPMLMNWFANWVLTQFTNLLFGSRLTDMETCYKVFRREVVEDMEINARRFDFEPEFTAKLLKQNVRVHEIPISFNPRGYAEGKKINAWDGVMAVWTLIKYRFVD